ncbi:14134_t:CDS:2 [Gigaspora margarita]|uniref:14134_t:CDS:1 n=1 Tax=Gigaspora margarita TaxID=4874 RepID=A0ABM8VX44_GIGMA|nr:14134_t:CDS:2 [Gigaspora margarita]
MVVWFGKATIGNLGQNPLDKYLDKIIQLWAYLKGHITVLKNTNAEDFNDAIKYNILKSMISRKYTLVLANNGLDESKISARNVGNQQLAIQRLTQETYQLYNIFDDYEARI